MLYRRCSCVLGLVASLVALPAATAGDFSLGLAKVDVTPAEPLRLSGYGSRTKPSEGIDQRLFVRVMALHSGDGPLNVIVSIDTVGFSAGFRDRVLKRIQKKHDLQNARFVLAATHTHAAPHIAEPLDNIFAKPLTDQEASALDRYKERVVGAIVRGVDEAVAGLQPGRLYYARGKATFAQNRRVINDGRWTGFGVRPAGPVDHSLPVLLATDEAGKQVRGLVFNYACHCTTLGGNYNRVNGDWAGYAAAMLDEAFDGAIAIPLIGCGADANPVRTPEDRAVELAQAHGREIAEEVERLVAADRQEITAAPDARYGNAGLSIDCPTVDELQERLADKSPQVRRHANNMLAIRRRMGRLPESYPMPIQVWRFGDELSMVFLGGEVCVDYALRIKRELTDGLTWVTAYANDVFGYVAPERMRSEGGYEVDSSMIYYNQPGRWSSGTEDNILRRVHELYEQSTLSGPRAVPTSVDEALSSFVVPKGYAVAVVAAEPLISDPVSFTVGPDGRLWVVEMGDYPERKQAGKSGGAVKVLTDDDGDGRYDRATTFLDGLVFPTTALPWRDGVIVSSGTQIELASDVDGDGRADAREPIVTGFNASAVSDDRPNTLYYGLDNWIYSTTGSGAREVTSARTGEVVEVSGRDLRFQPDSGRVQAVTGKSQWGRCRDDWGRWFGNNNGAPLYQFVLEDRYLRRNPFVASPSPIAYLTDPPRAPRLYPTSRTADRFNDQFDHNRFTSACGPQIFRDETLGPDMAGAAVVCEPVHNLVSRRILEPRGVTFAGKRHASEQTSEFFSSRDNWCRPCWLATGPDGGLWIADIYRHVIEHPNWIPEAWQARLDLYAGHDRGRIYRLYREDAPPTPIPNLAAMSPRELVEQFNSANGWRRDTAQQLLVQRGGDAAAPTLRTMLRSNDPPLARLHALTTLAALGELSAAELLAASRDPHPGVVRWSVALWEQQPEITPAAVERLLELVDHDDAGVRLQVALTLGETDDPRVGRALLELAARPDADHWLRAAAMSSARGHAREMLAGLLVDRGSIAARQDLLEDVIATALADDAAGNVGDVLAMIAPIDPDAEIQPWQFAALASCLDALAHCRTPWEEVAAESPSTAESAAPLFAAARRLARDDEAPSETRRLALRLLGRQSEFQEQDDQLLYDLLSPLHAPAMQEASLDALADRPAPNLAEALIKRWADFSPKLRSAVSAAIFSRRDWQREFLEAVESGEIPRGDVGAATRTAYLQHFDYGMRSAAHRAFGESGRGSESTDRQRVVDAYAEAATLPGDLAHGRKVFTRVCAACHRHGGVGVDHAPKLAAVGDKRPESLLTAILDPNRAVDDAFRQYVVVTSSGRTFAGLIKDETAGSITLVAPDGKPRNILRINIDELVNSGQSFMPVGLEKQLTPQDVADVIEFVRTAPPE